MTPTTKSNNIKAYRKMGFFNGEKESSMYEISEEKFDSILSKASEAGDVYSGFYLTFITADGHNATMWVTKEERVKSTRNWFKTTREVYYKYKCNISVYSRPSSEIYIYMDEYRYNKALVAYNRCNDRERVEVEKHNNRVLNNL